MKDVIGRARFIVTLMAISMLAAGCSFNIGGGFKEKYKKTVNLEAPLAADSTLEANTSFGGITALGSEVVDCNVIATISGQAPTKEEAKEIVEIFFDEIRDSLENNIQVKLSGFGNFDLREKGERPGRNPKTGEEIPITARRVVTFRPGQKLKARVEAYAGVPETDETDVNAGTE